VAQSAPHSTDQSPYAPVRYRGVPWWEMARTLARQGWVTPEGKIHGHTYGRIEHEYTEPMIRAMVDNLREQGLEDVIGQALAQVSDGPNWIVLAAQFEACGREIFDLNERLVAAFNETDLGNTTLEDWHTPYPAFFLRFGKQPHVQLSYDSSEGQFEYLEGAFVAVSPVEVPFPGKRIRMGMTTVLEDGTGMMGTGYFLDFHPNTHEMPIEQAIETALQMRKDAIDKGSTSDESELAINELSKARFEEAAELLRKGARLVFNSLFHIESLAERPSLVPGRDVPAELTKKWESANPRQREKLRSKLTADNFTVVRLLGRDFHEEGEESPEPTGASKAPHWRRAHWRQQACGEGLKHRKRIRIPKTLIHREQVDGELPGRIYKVEGEVTGGA
jgi:hypothetical protein